MHSNFGRLVSSCKNKDWKINVFIEQPILRGPDVLKAEDVVPGSLGTSACARRGCVEDLFVLNIRFSLCDAVEAAAVVRSQGYVLTIVRWLLLKALLKTLTDTC